MFRYVCAAFVVAACGGGDDFREASANLEARMESPITGYAYFAEVPTGTQVDLSLNNCADGKSYPAFILDGAVCTGGHWDTRRGEGIPDIVCNDLGLHSSYVRAPNDASTRWTIGDDSASDIKGHALVVYDADDPTKLIACGVILVPIAR